MTLDGVDRLIERQIREAREHGAFDDLPGRGKPLELEQLQGLTPEQRFEALLLRTCGEVLPEVVLLREIREGWQLLTSCKSPEERDALVASLRAKALEVSKLWRRPR